MLPLAVLLGACTTLHELLDPAASWKDYRPQERADAAAAPPYPTWKPTTVLPEPTGDGRTSAAELGPTPPGTADASSVRGARPNAERVGSASVEAATPAVSESPSRSGDSPRPVLDPPAARSGGPTDRGPGLTLPADGPLVTIDFARGGSALDDAGRRALREVAGALRTGDGGRIRVVGHASRLSLGRDPVRGAAANLAVSLDRALSVARELMMLGVPDRSIAVSALSDSQPRRPNARGPAGDQRAEVFLERPKGNE